jgi:hypothetical protein
VLAGYSTDAGNHNFALVRYNADGTLDNSFNRPARSARQLEQAQMKRMPLLFRTTAKSLLQENPRAQYDQRPSNSCQRCNYAG